MKKLKEPIEEIPRKKSPYKKNPEKDPNLEPNEGNPRRPKVDEPDNPSRRDKFYV